MQVDPEQLRQLYESLSDEELLAVGRADLIEVAQKYYDAELNRRELTVHLQEPDDVDEVPDVEIGPDWLEDAAEVYSWTAFAQDPLPPEAFETRDVLEAAGIPCLLKLGEIPKDPYSKRTHSWKLLVPGQLNMRAASIVDRDIFNQKFEDYWSAHLQELSDKELLSMSPKAIFCGLFDKVERVTRAYADEVARRRLK